MFIGVLNMEKDNKVNKDFKDIILSVAKNIAITQGITKITIRSVARNSGIAIGTVYNYFPSKGDLLVAVIEGFWNDAFSNIDWENFKHNDFYSNLEQVYSVLYIYFHQFRENWLDQLSLLKTREKQLGRQKEEEYFKQIHSKIIVLMDMDDCSKNYLWTEIITKEKMAEFIFENIITMLRRDEKNICFFIEILKKIMS